MKKVSIVFNFEKEELPEYECELERSKFFGSPVFPKSVIEKGFPEGWVFLCQLKMEDIEFYDESKLLPKKGYLYFFFEDNDRKKIHRIYATDQITDVV
ncbi:MAG: hypothetical protein HUJ61_07820, partial [Bacilli bacterium]|nr:hypothetical protein [Bacilli bacterium]